MSSVSEPSVNLFRTGATNSLTAVLAPSTH
jgi:hypothetical protein